MAEIVPGRAIHPDDRERAEGYRWFNTRGIPLFERSGALRAWTGVLLALPAPAQAGRPAG